MEKPPGDYKLLKSLEDLLVKKYCYL